MNLGFLPLFIYLMRISEIVGISDTYGIHLINLQNV